MMEEKPPDAEEPRPTLSVTLPAAPSIKKAGGAAALLHGLHLLLCVFSNAVYVSNEPGDDVLYPGQGYSFAITDKGKPNVMQREGTFVVRGGICDSVPIVSRPGFLPLAKSGVPRFLDGEGGTI